MGFSVTHDMFQKQNPQPLFQEPKNFGHTPETFKESKKVIQEQGFF